jgi:hypothetical protein
MSNGLNVDVIVDKLGLKVLTDNSSDRKVSSGYCCDMLSWVMSRLERDACWFTILSSMNVVAVASLTDCPLVIITEGVHVDETVLRKARDEDVCICSTEKDTYESVCDLYTLLNQSPENI